MRKAIVKYGIILVPVYILPLLIRGTSYEYLMGIFTLIAIFGIVIVGYDLLKGFAGAFSIAQFAFFGIGAYSSALITTKCNLPPILSLIIALAITLFFAFILGYLTLKLQFLYLAIATLAFGETFYRTLIGFPSLTGGNIGVHVPRLSILGFVFSSDIQYYYLAWSVALLSYTIASNMLHSRWGRALLAQNTDQVAAGCMGINVSKGRIEAFLISSAYASIAGSLYAHFQKFVVPEQFTLALAMDFIFMLFLGGIRTLWGGFIGVALLQIFPEILAWLRDYRPFVYGILLVIILMFMPEGIAGTLIKLWKNRSRRFESIRNFVLRSSGTEVARERNDE